MNLLRYFRLLLEADATRRLENAADGIREELQRWMMILATVMFVRTVNSRCLFELAYYTLLPVEEYGKCGDSRDVIIMEVERGTDIVIEKCGRASKQLN